MDIKNMSKLRLNDMKSVNTLLARTINSLIAGNVLEDEARAIGYLANILIKGLEKSDLENRLEELEKTLNNNRKVG